MAHSNLVPARTRGAPFLVDHFQESKNIFKDFIMYFYNGLPIEYNKKLKNNMGCSIFEISGGQNCILTKIAPKMLRCFCHIEPF